VFNYAPISDTDFDRITLTYELDSDSLHTKNKVSRSRLSKVRAQTWQTDRHIHTHRDVIECIAIATPAGVAMAMHLVFFWFYLVFVSLAWIKLCQRKELSVIAV